MNRANISTAAPSLQHGYDLLNVQLEWVFRAFVLGYALFQAPFGRFAGRFDPHAAIALDRVVERARHLTGPDYPD